LSCNSYEKLFSEIYDTLHHDFSDVEAFLRFGEKYGPEILELGSGTGRISIPLARAQNRVIGVETCGHMLERSKEKLNKQNRSVQNRVKFIQQDAKTLKLNKKFDLIIAPSNFVNYFICLDELQQLLDKVKNHLKPKTGVFIVDNSIPDLKYMLETDGKTEIFKLQPSHKKTLIIDRFKACYDFSRQLEYNHILLEEYDGEKLIQSGEGKNTLTYFFPRELRLILNTAGFEIFSEQGALNSPVPLDKDSREMVFFCRIP